MRPLLTRAQIRAYDAYAIGECGIPSLQLMENAGGGAAEVIDQAMRERGLDGLVAIVCGRGNNGGDGFVVARRLREVGRTVVCFLCADRADVRGDALASLDAWVAAGGALVDVAGDAAPRPDVLHEAAVVVDALFGTGLDRPLEGAPVAAIAAINAAPGLRVSLDVPSGIDCDTGAELGAAVNADLTVTFGERKLGLYAGAGAISAGTIALVKLGVPDSVLEAVGWRGELVGARAVVAALGTRAADLHKYQAGSVLVVGGSPGKIGAALLCARGALRAGAGLVTIASSPEACAAMDGRVPEVMTHRLDFASLDESLASALDRKNAVAIGPGLGLDARAREIVDRLAIDWTGPLVIDADAIRHLGGRAGQVKRTVAPRILTPHAGELARLFDTTAGDIDADRFASAERAASETGAVVVLKGRNTVIAAPNERLRVCDHGNPVLATAGTGDVLTGIVAALACHAPPFEAACAGVYLHGLAADRWRARVGADRGMLAGDLPDELPAAIAALER